MSFFYFILLLGGLIFFHELGHYVMARLAGVQVVTFSIGFGTSIVRFNRGGTEYRIALIPLGGYVKLLGDDPLEPVPAEMRSKAFLEQSLWKRFWIVFGGPLFNLILPFLVFFAMGLSTENMMPSTVGTVTPDGPAHRAGLRSGDIVTEIEGKPVQYWWQLVEEISGRPGQEMQIGFSRGEEKHQVTIVPKAVSLVRVRELDIVDEVGRIEISPDYALPIVWIQEGSVAFRAGLRTGDRIVAINQKMVGRWPEAQAMLESLKSSAFDITVVRADKAQVDDARLRLELVKNPTTLRISPVGSIPLGIESAELRVAEVDDGSPAHIAGLQVGDLVLDLDGRRFGSWPYFDRILRSEGTRPHILRVQRGDQTLSLDLVLVEEVQKNDIKIDTTVMVFGARNDSLYAMVDQIPNEQKLAYATHRMINDSVDAIRLTVLGVVGLFVGQFSYKDMGGPILVYNLASGTEKRGWDYFFRILVILSINLGLINLFPIPVLDGGHIMFILIEAVRRKPISMRVRQVATYVGLGLIMMLMILVFKNDIERNWDSIIQLFQGS